MSQTVEININGRDNSPMAFRSAIGSVKALGHEAKGLGSVFGQLGMLAASLGNSQMAVLAGSMEGALFNAKRLTGELAKSKLAVVALGTAVAVAGYEFGKWSGKQLNGLFDTDFFGGKQTIEQMDQIAAEYDAVVVKRTRLSSASAAAAMEEDNALRKQIDALVQIGKLEENQNDLLKQYRALQEDIAASRQDASFAGRADLNERLSAMSGTLLRKRPGSQDFTSDQQSYSPEQGGEVLAMRKQYDSMLEEFRKHTTDKDKIAAFSAQLEKSRAKATLDMHARFDRQELQTKLSVWGSQLEAGGRLANSLAQLAAMQGKKGFKTAQALRYAGAVMDTAGGIARAFVDYPWPYALIPAAAVAAAGAVQIAMISSQKAPQAHGGLDYVPSEQTFLLSKGERVVQPKQNRRLTEFLDNTEAGGGGGRSSGDVYLDGEKVGRMLYRMSKNGRLPISSRAIQAS